MALYEKPLAFIKRDFITALSYRFAFILQIVSIFLSTTMFYFLSRLIGHGMTPYLEPYGGDYFSFVLIGIAFASYLSVSLYSFSQQLRDSQLQGVVESLLATPSSLFTIILCSCLYPFIFATLQIIVYLAFGALIFDLPLGNANYFAAFVTLLLSIVSFSSLGIISAAFIMVFKKGSPIEWAIGSLSWLLCGTLYPIAVLPSWLQNLSHILPLTYSLHAMRLTLLQGAPLSAVIPDLIALAIFALVTLPLSFVAFNFATNRAKVEGSLAHY